MYGRRKAYLKKQYARINLQTSGQSVAYEKEVMGYIFY
jgi:hypothetical protein